MQDGARDETKATAPSPMLPGPTPNKPPHSSRSAMSRAPSILLPRIVEIGSHIWACYARDGGARALRGCHQAALPFARELLHQKGAVQLEFPHLKQR